MSGDVPSAGDTPGHADFPDCQAASDHDQTLSDRDQTASDSDQTSADIDQTASERDQLAADRDQRSSDRDHAASPAADSDEDYEKSREGRWHSTIDRDRAAAARSESASSRHSVADERDAAASRRDELAAERDRAATQLDQLSDLSSGNGSANGRTHAMSVLASAARDRQRAAANRIHAAAQREAAARDRASAAEDRRQAAHDRATAEAELARHGIDDLTGSLRRHVGLDAMQREWDRTRRAKEAFVAAFIDVDGLKAVNDEHGHKAGDELLQAVARCAKERLRNYDVIARYGGDEFVVTISGQDVAAVTDRFEQIARHLAETAPGASITFGLAERETEETLTELIERADAAMRAHRQSR